MWFYILVLLINMVGIIYAAAVIFDLMKENEELENKLNKERRK